MRWVIEKHDCGRWTVKAENDTAPVNGYSHARLSGALIELLHLIEVSGLVRDGNARKLARSRARFGEDS